MREVYVVRSSGVQVSAAHERGWNAYPDKRDLIPSTVLLDLSTSA